MEVYGIKRGYEGLLDGEIVKMEWSSVGDILQRGGTILRTARSSRFMEDKWVEHGARMLDAFGIDGLIVVGDFRFLLPHGVGKHLIHRKQDVFVRAEILLQKDLALLRVRVQRIFLILAQEQRGVRQAEAVNALLHVPHHEGHILPRFVQCPEHGLLDAGNILVFVDEQRVELARHGGAHLFVPQRL